MEGLRHCGKTLNNVWTKYDLFTRLSIGLICSKTYWGVAEKLVPVLNVLKRGNSNETF